MKRIHVVGMSHIDLGFTLSEEELDECTEIFVERMLSVLDRDPEICFSIEQMSHYRKLLRDRPDLHTRVRNYIQSGRIEIMGAMASTMETNFPNGECFIRNQKIGLDWAEKNFGAKPESAWLIDTFGLHAQIPQIHHQFGFEQVFANRFGADKLHDIFLANGIDGSKLLVIGRDAFTPNLSLKQHAFVYSRWYVDTERLFRDADQLQGDGPCLVTYYIENEGLLSLLYVKRTRERQNRENEKWILSTYHDFLADLRANPPELPVLNADLNPEFTGTFALRTPVKQENRKTETALLEAEKWTSLLLPEMGSGVFESAWWEMAFNHFHDVFTGSHTDATFHSVLDKFASVQKLSKEMTTRAIEKRTRTEENSLTLLNGLPWERTSWVQLPHELECKQLLLNGTELPSVIRKGTRFCRISLPATGAASFQIGPSSTPSLATSENRSFIQNEFLRLSVDPQAGAFSLCLSDGTILIDNAVDYLTLQDDIGTLQVEDPINTELFATAFPVSISPVSKDAMGETITLSGTLSAKGKTMENRLSWVLEFRLNEGENTLQLHLETNWIGEGARVRLNIPTTVNAANALYEIPFGVVERTGYHPRATAKGEWAAHRFALLEDTVKGIALLNTGVAGVEISGRTLSTTLLRAHTTGPKAWVTPTPISSQHGPHSYDFALLPYRGSWKNACVLSRAQEFNCTPVCVPNRTLPEGTTSFVSVDHENIVLSSIKAADDSSGDLILRVYESFGEETSAQITVEGATRARLSDVCERIGDDLPCANGVLTLSLKPFEIQTLRIQRKA